MHRIERAGLILLAAVLGPAAASAYPTVTITEPAKGARVSGLVQIRAVAVPDPDPIERVDFFVLNTYLPSPTGPVCSDSTPPYECSWRSRTVDNGVSIILAEAFVAGTSRAVTEVDVMVVNGVVGELRLTIPNPMQSYERPQIWGPKVVYHDQFFNTGPYTGENLILDLGTLQDRDIGFVFPLPDAIFNNVVPFGAFAVYSEEYPAPLNVRNLLLYDATTGLSSLLWGGSQVRVGDLDFFGERIVWADQIQGSAELLNRNIHALDLVTRQDFNLGPGHGPAMWGNTAVWFDVSGPQKVIRAHDFSTSQTSVLAAVDGGDDVLGISGQWVVWTAREPTLPDMDGLHLLNMFTGEHSLIGNPNNQRSPAIWGGRIVWTEVRGGTQDVFVYDLATRAETRVTNDAVAELFPDIFGDVVVWHDNRFGGSGTAGEALTVFASDLKGRRAEPRPLGYLESVDATGIARGWAVSPAAPATTVHLAFYDGPLGTGRLLGEAEADRPRADVNRITLYPGDHGFEFTVPANYQDGQDHSLFVYILENSTGIVDGLLLDGCPMVFRLDPS